MIAVQEVCNYGDLCRPNLRGAIGLGILFAAFAAPCAAAVVFGFTDYLKLARDRRIFWSFLAAVAAVAVTIVLTVVLYSAAWTDYRRAR